MKTFLAALFLCAWEASAATIYVVNIGAAPNDATGDTLRSAFGKVNTNFANLNNSVSNLQVAGEQTVFTNGAPVGIGHGSNVNWMTGVTGYQAGSTINLGVNLTGGGATNAIANLNGQGTNTTVRGLTLPLISASRVAVISASGDLTNSPNVDLTEIEFLDGVTSSIQTQINANKLSTNGNQFGASPTLTIKNGASITNLIIRTSLIADGNFIATNGFYQFGDANTVTLMTNWAGIYQRGQFIMNDAGQLLSIQSGAALQVDRGSSLSIGLTGPAGSSALQFGTNGYAVSFPSTDNNELYRYRFFSDNSANTSNKVARFWEVTNVVSGIGGTGPFVSRDAGFATNPAIYYGPVGQKTNLAAWWTNDSGRPTFTAGQEGAKIFDLRYDAHPNHVLYIGDVGIWDAVGLFARGTLDGSTDPRIVLNFSEQYIWGFREQRLNDANGINIISNVLGAGNLVFGNDTGSNVLRGAGLINIEAPVVTITNLIGNRAVVTLAGGKLSTATGTPDGTKFLRDDNTYAVPPGGAGSLATNANQFGASLTLTIKDFAQFTNTITYSNATVAGITGKGAPILKLLQTNGTAFNGFSAPDNWLPTNLFVFSVTNPVAGQVLKIDSVTSSGGIFTTIVTNGLDSTGSATPGGLWNDIQLNSNGVFFASSDFNYDTTNKLLRLRANASTILLPSSSEIRFQSPVTGGSNYFGSDGFGNKLTGGIYLTDNGANVWDLGVNGHLVPMGPRDVGTNGPGRVRTVYTTNLDALTVTAATSLESLGPLNAAQVNATNGVITTNLQTWNILVPLERNVAAGTITLKVSSSNAMETTVSTNANFTTSFSGTPQHGKRVILTITNSAPATDIVVTSDAAYDYESRTSITTWTVKSNSVAAIHWLFQTNYVGGGIWYVERKDGFSYALAQSGTVKLNTNGDNIVLDIPSGVSLTGAVFVSSAVVTQLFSPTLSNATVKPLVVSASQTAAGATNTTGQIRGIESTTGTTVAENGSNVVVGVSTTLGNLSGTRAITNVVSAVTNADFNSLLRTTNNDTVVLMTIGAGSGIFMTNNGTNIMIAAAAGTGEANVNGEVSVTNATTMGLVFDKVSITNRLRSLRGGNGITLTNEGTNITIAATVAASTNLPVAAYGYIDLTNQIMRRTTEFSGSATSQQIDFNSSTLYVITNQLNTNITFWLTNMANGREATIEVPGNALGTNFNVIVSVMAGSTSTNIKWLSNTNGNYEFTAQSNATYYAAFKVGTTPLATNIIAGWGTTTGNPIRNFPAVTAAGSSASNTFDGGLLFKVVVSPAFTNLNNAIGTFTNGAQCIIGAHTLTNNNDSHITVWRGKFLAGTNSVKLIYGYETVLATGSFTNADTAFEAGMEITRTGNVGAHADAWVRFAPISPALTVANDTGFYANTELSCTNGTAVTNVIQLASNRSGSISNNFMRVTFEPGPR